MDNIRVMGLVLAAVVVFAFSTPAWGDPLIPGDANNDGIVNVTDLGILATYYDQGDGFGWNEGDFTGDGFVSVNDLGVLATNYGYGTVVQIQSVPEPGTFTLLLLGLASLLCRRRRK